MTPLGHLSVSYLAGRTTRNISLVGVIVGGVLPDIDFVLFLSPSFNQIHRVITHNLMFVTLAAIAGLLVSREGRRRTLFLSLLLGGVLHLFVDSCMDANASNGVGIALLWPFETDYFFSPFNLFTPAENVVDWTDPVAYAKITLMGMVWEIPFILLSALLLLRKRLIGRTLPQGPETVRRCRGAWEKR